MVKKSHITALLLSLFLGGLGIDRFYLGHKWVGFFKLFTGGGFLIVAVIDFFRIAFKGNFSGITWD